MSAVSEAPIQARFGLRYPGFCLNLDLRLPGQGISALFGPSGSGKTTCLRCLAGLERPREAFLSVQGEIWQDSTEGYFLPVHKRPLGYVFQEASLFPHLSVRGNLLYGLRRARQSAGNDDWDRVLGLLGIDHLLERPPATLSGGERQRVAIARALLCRPRLLLMDEPLAALDRQRKDEILPYLERLREQWQIPIVYVSHALDEVARLADHLVILEAGRAVAQGPLQATLARLDLAPLYGREAGVMVQARVAEQDPDFPLTRLALAGGALLVARRDEPFGALLRCRIVAKDVGLTRHPCPDEGNPEGHTAATVVQLSPAGAPGEMLVHLDAQGTPLLARLTQRAAAQLDLAPGQPVWAHIRALQVLG